MSILNSIKSWFKNLFSKPEEEVMQESVNNINHKKYTNFEDVYNMFTDGVQKMALQEYIKQVPIHKRNCNTCKGCKMHSRGGGIIYCCPHWIPKNFKGV